MKLKKYLTKVTNNKSNDLSEKTKVINYLSA